MVAFSPESARICLPSSTLVPSIRTDERRLAVGFAVGVDDASRGDVAPEDAAEDVHEHFLDVPVGEHEEDGVADLLLACAAANVEEVGRLCAPRTSRCPSWPSPDPRR